jgi:hypothetical protein
LAALLAMSGTRLQHTHVQHSCPTALKLARWLGMPAALASQVLWRLLEPSSDSHAFGLGLLAVRGVCWAAEQEGRGSPSSMRKTCSHRHAVSCTWLHRPQPATSYPHSFIHSPTLQLHSLVTPHSRASDSHYHPSF